jgi:hypothetical protein
VARRSEEQGQRRADEVLEASVVRKGPLTWLRTVVRATLTFFTVGLIPERSPRRVEVRDREGRLVLATHWQRSDIAIESDLTSVRAELESRTYDQYVADCGHQT